MSRLLRVGLVLGAMASVASATPWTDRCKARLARAVPALKPIGKARIAVAPPPARPRPRSGQLKDTDPIGELSLVVVAGDRTYTATIGADHSGHRYRGKFGMEAPRYDEWHSPYLDSRNGDPPALTVQPMLEEYHHHLDVGVVRAELRVDIAAPPPGSPPRKPGPVPSPHGPRPPTYTGNEQLFASTLRPVLEACWTDVKPAEQDESLGWTTACLADLRRAQAALDKRDPIFKNGSCAREPFGASCGHVAGAEPTWNALTSLAADAQPALVWKDDGTNRKRYDGGALIWGSAQLTSTQFAELFAAFDQPLARCAQLMRTNMFVP